MKCFSLVLIFTLSVGCIIAQFPCDWSCFHDPGRTHKLAETGLPDAWLEGGPAIVWTSEGQGKGSINFTDVMLCCLGEKGTMPLVRATPDAYLPAGSFIIPESGPGAYSNQASHHTDQQ